jgi:hypothetical protein
MYCKKVLRDGPDDKISHGACEPCTEVALEEIRRMRQQREAA